MLTIFSAIAHLALVAVLALFVVGLATAVVVGTISAFPRGDLVHPETLAWLPLGLLGAWLGMGVIASLAFAMSLVARSQWRASGWS